jgi:adenylyltransferase/sulfurtransferase
VLTKDELIRFSRHLTLSELGTKGQERLKAARVLCVGAGGLGSPAAIYLAAAGVGTIGLVEFDVVEESNLQRQVLYTTADVGRSKLQVARERLTAMNPHLNVEAHEVRLSASNALRIIESYDVIVDGTDNFATRYLVNDACVLAGRPNAYGSIFRFEGQASVFGVKDGPCYRCLHPEPPPAGLVPSCAEAGVLGVLPGIIGTIQATEAIKLVTGIGESLVGRFVIYDALRMRFRELKLPKDPQCAVCGEHPTIRELTEYEGYCDAGRLKPASTSDTTSVAAGFNETGVVAGFSRPGESMDMSVKELKERMDRGGAPRLIDVREPHEHAICNIPGAELIPAAQFIQRLGEFDPNAEIVVHCKSGGRSGRAVEMMKARGFTNARNLAGGMLAWIDQVDPSQRKY